MLSCMSIVNAIALFLLGGLALNTRAVDRQALLDLLEFPTATFALGFTVNDEEIAFQGINNPPKPSLEDRIADLKARLAKLPESPGLHYELGLLYEDKEEKELAAAEFEQAVLGYQKIFAVNKTPRTVEGLARALTSADRMDEAEAILRQFLAENKRDGHCWAALARILSKRGFTALTEGEPISVSVENIHAIREEIRQLPPDKLAAVQSLLAESLQSYAKATEFAPGETAFHQQKIALTYLAGMLDFLPIAGSAGSATAIPVGPMRADAQLAARQNPHSTPFLGLWMMLEVIDPLTRGHDVSDLPDETFARLQEGEKMLRAHLQQAEGHDRYQALIFLGFTQMALGEIGPGKKTLREAIALDPTQDLPFELMIVHAAMTRQWPEVMKICAERAKVHESPENRFMAARAAYKMENLDAAKAELEAAVQLDRSHYKAQLGRVVLLLKSGKPAAIEQAVSIATRLAELPDLPAEIRHQVLLFRAVAHGLNADSATARGLFNDLLEADPKNETARKGLAALE